MSEGARVGQIDLPDLDTRVQRPVATLERARRTGEAAERVTRIEETRRKPASNVAGDPRDGDALDVKLPCGGRRVAAS